jgi:hypothetical protein
MEIKNVQVADVKMRHTSAKYPGLLDKLNAISNGQGVLITPDEGMPLQVLQMRICSWVYAYCRRGQLNKRISTRMTADGKLLLREKPE